MGFKFFKRRLFCFIFIEYFGLKRECSHIGPKRKRMLWINWAAPSLGDSLMDLAARVLLADRELTLLTHPKNAPLYADDAVFQSVYSDPVKLLRDKGILNFDLVICDAFSPRVLVRKTIVAPLTPFVGLYGYLNGFEIHRTRFAFERMKELLGINQVRIPVRPTLSVSGTVPSPGDSTDVCIALGGEWAFRTYDQWPTVVTWLVEQGYSVSLIGSDNGKADAVRIVEIVPMVRSTVGNLALSEVVSEIARSKVFMGADGGLWHMATAIGRPSVVLFADCQIFDENGSRVTRETNDMVCGVLYDEVRVANIPANDVIQSLQTLFDRLDALGELKLPQQDDNQNLHNFDL